MKDMLKLGGLLLLITVIAATALAAVYKVTKPRILEQKRLVLERALILALPDADKTAIVPVKKDDKVLYYRGYANPDTSKFVGYAFVAYGQGYSSVIETMVGVDSTGKIIGLKVMSQMETPGLGSRIEEVKYGEKTPWFQDQFHNRNAAKLAVDKDGGKIQSITGATISSRALTKSIVAGYKILKKEISRN
ncbi:MAG: RnfABCDGE type electron transport complex subunit G [Calditrichaeota bacterium]|nr:RnfABCDGE type electron transport complex subunit G [Calditrichota bacterium]